MRYLLQLAILLAAFDASAGLAAERLRPVQPQLAQGSLAQVQLAQVTTPGTPIPITPTPLIAPPASTACLVSCDTQVMNCQNSCIVVGPTAPNPAGTSPCTLSCTTQQLVCKQACSTGR